MWSRSPVSGSRSGRRPTRSGSSSARSSVVTLSIQSGRLNRSSTPWRRIRSSRPSPASPLSMRSASRQKAHRVAIASARAVERRPRTGTSWASDPRCAVSREVIEGGRRRGRGQQAGQAAASLPTGGASGLLSHRPVADEPVDPDSLKTTALPRPWRARRRAAAISLPSGERPVIVRRRFPPGSASWGLHALGDFLPTG